MMIDRDHTIWIGADDPIPDTLRVLLDLADDPREVQFNVGTREVHVSQSVHDRWLASRSGEDAEAVEETPAPAPRARRPRKAASAPATEES